MEDGRKKKRKTRKAEDEKSDPVIDLLVGAYGILVMGTHVMKRDSPFSTSVIRAFILGYHAGKISESDKEKFGEEGPLITALKVLLNDSPKCFNGVYELYLLRWSLVKGREIWFKVQDNREKAEALFNDSNIEADKKEVLLPTDPVFKKAVINYEDLSPEMKNAMDDLLKGNKDKLS